MDLFKILGGLAALTAIATALIKLILWIKKKTLSNKKITANETDLWDVTIYNSGGDSTVIARLTVKANSNEEAVYRARFLVEEWNQIKLGFAFPLGQNLPVDDEANEIRFVRSDLLPQADGERLSLSADAKKRK